LTKSINKTKKHFVYALYTYFCEKLYIGKTNDIDRRLNDHLREARKNKKKNTIKLNWIRSRGENNIRIVVITGPFLMKKEAFDEETRLISEYRAAGVELVNDPRTKGGECGPDCTGIKRTPEQVKRLKIAMQVAMNKPETIEKISVANIGRKNSIESIEKRRQKIIGRKHTIETREKMSKTRTGRKYTLKHIINAKNGRRRNIITLIIAGKRRAGWKILKRCLPIINSWRVSIENPNI
jgi:predicted GIY-YIG superfamily endonuclease